MQVRLVDPRDTRWEIDRPTYRVHFWCLQDADAQAGWAAEEWEIEDADVDEVLRWANDEAHGRQFVLYARGTDSGEPGLPRLRGADPTARS